MLLKTRLKLFAWRLADNWGEWWQTIWKGSKICRGGVRRRASNALLSLFLLSYLFHFIFLAYFPNNSDQPVNELFFLFEHDRGIFQYSLFPLSKKSKRSKRTWEVCRDLWYRHTAKISVKYRHQKGRFEGFIVKYRNIMFNLRMPFWFFWRP